MNKHPITLEIKEMSFWYDQKNIILNDVNFSLKSGELACLLGVSGCGKSSLLSLILGENLPLSGEIKLSGEVVSTSKHWIPIEKRNVGIVLQDLCLFPFLTVQKNIEFGLSKWSKSNRKKQVSKILKIIEMESFSNRYPHQISGGQQQRVVLARALAPEPSLLLLDEPFSNLDESLRIKLCNDVKKILKELKSTALMVTHHEREANVFASRIGRVVEKKIVWKDSPFSNFF